VLTPAIESAMSESRIEGELGRPCDTRLSQGLIRRNLGADPRPPPSPERCGAPARSSRRLRQPALQQLGETPGKGGWVRQLLAFDDPRLVEQEPSEFGKLV
jgi:hypothetical protein